MLCKAAVMGDERSFHLIRKAADPIKTKALGRKVSKFDQAKWDSVIQEVAFRKRVVEDFILEPKLGQARAWLYEQGDVLEETGDENGNIKLKVELDEVVLARFLEKFPTVDVAS